MADARGIEEEEREVAAQREGKRLERAKRRYKRIPSSEAESSWGTAGGEQAAGETVSQAPGQK